MLGRNGRTLVVACLVLATASCSGRIDTRGNLADPEVVSQISPGESTRGTVEDLLGSPTTVATFNDRTWYYIGRKTEKLAFFAPEVLEQQVVAIQFDSSGFVEEVKIYGPDDARQVELVERTTPTAGKDLTVLQQLFGNLGRFNTSEGQGPSPRAPTPYP
ncbi:MAG TPA: outer membrane protein assembly factor BamE [Alphaproteobacteria bacterium]|nr:outer membrane protein assembly factor BamE [Alphaproteobacteria bacterium]